MYLDKLQEQQFEQLYQEMFGKLCNYANLSLRNRSLAEEAVQETFQIACSRSDKMFESGNPKGWLVKALKFVLMNTARSRARLNQLMLEALTVPEDFPDENSLGTINDITFQVACESILGEDDYKLLHLLTVKNYSLLEAAEEFGIALETCKKRAYRARKKLRKHLEKD